MSKHQGNESFTFRTFPNTLLNKEKARVHELQDLIFTLQHLPFCLLSKIMADTP